MFFSESLLETIYHDAQPSLNFRHPNHGFPGGFIQFLFDDIPRLERRKRSERWPRRCVHSRVVLRVQPEEFFHVLLEFVEVVDRKQHVRETIDVARGVARRHFDHECYFARRFVISRG